jgi:hypothetical protein
MARSEAGSTAWNSWPKLTSGQPPLVAAAGRAMLLVRWLLSTAPDTARDLLRVSPYSS